MDDLSLPPQNLQAEVGVLGAMLLDPAVIDDVMALVNPSDFYRDSHEILARAIFELHSLGTPVDSITLEEHLIATGELGRVGGLDAILAIRDAVPHAVAARYHAMIVLTKAIMRRAITAAHETIRDAYSSHFSIEEFLDTMERRTFAVSDDASRRSEGDVATSVEVGAESMAAIEQRRVCLAPPGLSTGLLDLDEILRGVDGSQLVVLAGRPTTGKTSLALQWAHHITAFHRQPVLFVSLEMVRRELMDRQLAFLSGIDGSRIRLARCLSDGEMVRLDQVVQSFRDHPPILYDHTPSLNANQIAASARRVKARHGLGAVFVDYLQIIDTSDSESTRSLRQEQVAAITRRLKTLSRELDVPVIALAQLNRSSESRDGNRPRLSDLRETGQIEQDAHSVVFVHRPELYDPNDSPGLAELIVAKNRNGAIGAAKVVFRKNLTCFANLQPEF